ncbi:phosphopentomutase [Hujiaoplasma nucleasis]|uniref:Phosphopentomutase n=1 Tax=Hujiaoplasma nucleasis TaxID=2725268 RepID=A0A7L6N325_9MOLU|nr:phosphopentomutase [Hujiaoplasma nucleasis]QLY39618.1 phosphopentomutase [Hujiaoplasma nucleasis]
MKYKRIFLIVIDSVGVGELPDADKFNDLGANTIANLAKETGGIHLPVLESFGYGNLTEIQGVKPVQQPRANTTKMMEISNGKDTMTGHWEIMGIKTVKPFKTFTDSGFPQDLIEKIEELSSRKVIGNKSASGTEILKELGPEQEKTGALIVYTSADSVLQIAAHEEVIPLKELYDICEKVRELTLDEKWRVGRIIARPYLGSETDGYKRTTNRHDYALSPTSKTVLDILAENNYDVISVGKIKDIFNGSGITDHYGIKSNHDGMNKVMMLTEKEFTGLNFTNLVDFDALYGHRRDSQGYKEAMEEFDRDLGQLITKLRDDDLLMVTADHGNDPTHHGTDHTREYVPLFIYNHKLKGSFLDISKTFADIGQTIADNFGLSGTEIGTSLLNDLK